MKPKTLLLQLFIVVFLTTNPLLHAQEKTGYPEFSWDHVPLYMHMRKSTAFTQQELEYLAGFPLVTLEKTTGSATYGSSEEGSRAAARAIKNINHNTKVLYYRNVMVNYSTYEVNAGLDTIPDAFLKDSNGYTLLHNDVRQVYDLSNPELRKWWVDHCVEMANYEEIDGIFIDGNVKALAPAYLKNIIGEEKKAAVKDGFEIMMKDLNERMDTTKLKLANLIRAILPSSGIDYLHYFDGSYMEGIDGDRDYLAEEIAAAQTAARDGKIVAFCMNLADELPVLPVDYNGHLVLNGSQQERMDFALAMFLICAEEYSYFLMHDSYNVNPGASNLWMKRFAEYDKPLGPPEGPAIRDGYIYTRKFEHADVQLDLTSQQGNISWDSDSGSVSPPDYTVKFKLKEAYSSNFVSEAEIILDTLKNFTNVAGEQFFRLESGNYNYIISKPGYFQVDSSLSLHSDTLIYIELYPTTADVQFRIRQDGNPVMNAEISINGKAVQSNSVGLAAFSDLPVNTDYSYSVSKTEFEMLSGNIHLIKDTIINLTLSLLGDFKQILIEDLKIYPIPTREEFIIDSEKEMSQVRLYDVSGKLFFSAYINGFSFTKAVTERMPSIYLLKIIFRDGTMVTKTMFRSLNI